MEKIEDYKLEDNFETFVEPKKGILRWFFGLFISDKKIGELNGRWAALFKLVLFIVVVSVPTAITWMLWVTSNIYASQYHIERCDNYEQRLIDLEKTDVSRADLSRQMQVLSDKIETFPNAEWKRRVEFLEQKIETLAIKTNELDKVNSTEHTHIITEQAAQKDLLLKIYEKVK